MRQKKIKWRIEKDSMGPIKIPATALYGPQTERARHNFKFSHLTLPRAFIESLGLIKSACAIANAQSKTLAPPIAKAIIKAAESVTAGRYDEHFPIDVFQTGSGTSTNMNANEVIAHLASHALSKPVHPNNDVNKSQSSNDVIPSAIHVSCSLQIHRHLLPTLKKLEKTIAQRARTLKKIVKTGRTHLMDALPLTFEQELSGWQHQILQHIKNIQFRLKALSYLAIGGTAIGTGLNAPKNFGKLVAAQLSKKTKLQFKKHPNYFCALSFMEPVLALSAELRSIATTLIKISNDLRLMNSGPLAGFSEISLAALQPGSSIMPGKVNPVIPEAVIMASIQVIGLDTAIGLSAAQGQFQLNTLLPLIAYNSLLSIELIANSAGHLADKAIATFRVNPEHIAQKLSENPILMTALNPIIGYEKGAEIVKKAYQEKRPIKAVAQEMLDLPKKDLDRLLDPKRLIK